MFAWFNLFLLFLCVCIRIRIRILSSLSFHASNMCVGSRVRLNTQANITINVDGLESWISCFPPCLPILIVDRRFTINSSLPYILCCSIPWKTRPKSNTLKRWRQKCNLLPYPLVHFHGRSVKFLRSSRRYLAFDHVIQTACNFRLRGPGAGELFLSRILLRKEDHWSGSKL